MAITYHIDSLTAKLTVLAVSQRYGKQIQQDLHWQLKQQNHKNPMQYESDENQPVFNVPPGDYQLIVHHKNREIIVEGLALERNAHRQEIIYVEEEQFDPEADYYVNEAEYDVFVNYSRRLLERDGQRKFGLADGPIKDPHITHGNETHLEQHPILQNSVQFDGADANVTPTSENEEALHKTLELQHQLNPAPLVNPYDSPKPKGG